MTKRDIAQKMLEALPDEFSSARSTQLLFDFASPSPRGIHKADEYVKVIIGSVKGALMAGETVEISGFGKFIVRQKKERTGRNPRTGEKAVITARKVVSFKPSRRLKDIVNGNQT